MFLVEFIIELIKALRHPNKIVRLEIHAVRIRPKA